MFFRRPGHGLNGSAARQTARVNDRWGPDPTHRLWERWRRPVLILGAVLFVANQWERLVSGHPFTIATGAGVAAFWITVLVVRSAPMRDQRIEPEPWRTLGRRRLIIFGAWTLVAFTWLAVAATLYSVRPVNFLGPAIPALLTATAWWTYSKADRLAELQRRAISV